MAACPPSTVRLALVVALCVASVFPGAAEGCNCDKLDLAGPLVCGLLPGGEATLASRCVAECQGIGVLHEGPCGAGLHLKAGHEGQDQTGGGRVRGIDWSKVVTDASVDAATLGRFSKLGYTFSAQLRLRTGKGPKAQLRTASRSAEPASQAATSTTVLASIMTKTGHLYLKPIPKFGSSSGPATARDTPSPSSGPVGRRLSAGMPNRGGRKALVVGYDDRVEINTDEYPWRTVGYLSMGQEDDWNEGEIDYTRCSGALIGRNAALTAGHCVYDPDTGEFIDFASFYPNQQGGEPGYSVGVTWVASTFNNAGGTFECDDGSFDCHSREDFMYDFSVLALEEMIGDDYGYLGYGYDCDLMQYDVVTAGYPGDKPKWRMYGDDGTLDPFWGCVEDLENSIISSNLDTYGGQSGSAIWDGENNIRAIHVAHSKSDGGVPLHRTISQWVYETVYEWKYQALSESEFGE